MADDNTVREWRQARGLSQEALAATMTEFAGLWPLRDDQTKPRSWGRTDIIKVEKGKRAPDTDFLRAAAAALRCRVRDLVDRLPGEPEPVPEAYEDVAKAWDDLPESERAVALRMLRGLKE